MYRNPASRVKYQKSNFGGLEYNVTDSEWGNDLEVKINVPKRERWEANQAR